MRLQEWVKALLTDNFQIRGSNRQQIVISSRSDGLTAAGLPYFVAPWVSDFDGALKCSDGTKLPARTVPTLITGSSENKEEILLGQIASAVRGGHTPIVLSADGRQGSVYRVLQQIYPEFAINYVSKSVGDGSYDPFGSVPRGEVERLFCEMVAAFQQQPGSSMLIRNYVNVCVAVLFADGSAVDRLMAGQLTHMGLLEEIRRLHQNGSITDRDRTLLENAANSAQSVSVAVFSVIQDYLCKLWQPNASRPAIHITGGDVPRITILNTNGDALRPSMRAQTAANRYDLTTILDRKCLFFQLENELWRFQNNLPNEQCFQWYVSKTLQMEMNARPDIRSHKILLVIENINSTLLNWFWWLIDLPNCVLLLSYDDFYSAIADSQERRQQLIGRMDRIYFFSVIDEQSAAWASRTFGTHMVPKVVVTDQPYREWVDLFFRPRSYAHDEIEKPWFSPHEIQHLGSSGIVYSKQDKIFTARYRENGKMYTDRSYRGQRVNFCTFGFR